MSADTTSPSAGLVETNGHQGSLETTPIVELDALIVGAGFGGCYQLHRLRKEGFNVKLVEWGEDYGGIWHFNTYPGARVDTPTPFYSFSDPELWKEWHWKERFPGSVELRAYFRFVAEKWDLRRDTIFETFVESATWIEEDKKWIVKTRDGKVFKVTFLLLNLGFAAKRFTPDWEGVKSFKGEWIHSSFWPQVEPDLKGKKVAVIGTGATGVQIAQELAPIASNLVVFQRTLATAMPMGQVNYEVGERQFDHSLYPSLLANRYASFGGFDYNFTPSTTFEHTPEERLAHYESLWSHGDFHFWLATYQDMLFDKAANEEAYAFWASKVRPRILDPKTREMLAPLKQKFAFGTKRIPLERNYYDIFNQGVELVDVTDTPITRITETGIQTTEKAFDFDYIIAATGFDSVTGGFDQIDIRGTDGLKLKDKWSTGIKTHLGMSVNGFPNMLFTYGPQAPTAFCNGPVCAEMQGNFIAEMLLEMRSKGLQRVEGDTESEEKWAAACSTIVGATLLPETKSWYFGDNVPGKNREVLVYLGGAPAYYETLEGCSKEGYTGFKMA